jgi:hypothetical protein
MPECTTLYWKYEEEPSNVQHDDQLAVGPAWIIEPDGTERDVQGGEWITRAEASRIAHEHGYAFDDLENVALTAESSHGSESVEVEGLNRQLRAVGVTETQLLIEHVGDYFDLSGTIPDAYARRAAPKLPDGRVAFSPESSPIGVAVFSEAGLYQQLDSFAPGWREA